MAVALVDMKPGSFDAAMLTIDGAAFSHQHVFAAGNQTLMRQAEREIRNRLAALKPAPDQSWRLRSSPVPVHRFFGVGLPCCAATNVKRWPSSKRRSSTGPGSHRLGKSGFKRWTTGGETLAQRVASLPVRCAASAPSIA